MTSPPDLGRYYVNKISPKWHKMFILEYMISFVCKCFRIGWNITQWLVVRLNLFYGGILKWEPSRGESACVNRSNPRNPIWRQPPQVKHASSIYIHSAFCNFIFDFVNENNILNDFKLLKIFLLSDINLSCDFN